MPLQQDVEFAFEKANLSSWIADIKALIAKDLEGLPGLAKGKRCLLPGYYVMRFGKQGDTLTGFSTGLEEPVYVQVRWEGVEGSERGAGGALLGKTGR